MVQFVSAATFTNNSKTLRCTSARCAGAVHDDDLRNSRMQSTQRTGIALAAHHPLARATSSAFLTAKHVHCKPRCLKAPARDHTTLHLHFQRPSGRAHNCAQSVTRSAAQMNSSAKHAGTRRVRGTCRWARRSMRCRRNGLCLQVAVRMKFRLMSGEMERACIWLM